MARTSERSRSRVPVVVWALAVVGGVVGLMLAEPGDVVGNTIPSTLFFAVVGLVLGLVIHLVSRRVRRW